MNNFLKYISIITTVTFISFQVLSDAATTSGMSGSVNVGGATVEAVHTPTGISKTTTAGSSGNFFLSFLPLGGPYTVTVSSPGYNNEKLTGLYLNLGDPAKFSVILSGATSADEVVVVGQSISGFRMGTSTVISRGQMDGVPTINRSVADYAKFDPRVSVNGGVGRDAQISIMGANNRFNDFTIDGVSFNDPFGLNANGFGTMRNPISMDFVQQMSIEITPFDASRGNATGGMINVVTKSGTNDFHGSIYYSERDESNVGDYDGKDFPTFEEEVTAFTLGGPIIKDRLFFFVGYEENEKALPGLYGTVDSGAMNTAETLTTALAEEIRQYTIANYGGYDPGYINMVTNPETHEEYTVKIDAVLNDDHRATLNVSHSEDQYFERYNWGATVFSNNWYVKPPEIDRASIELFSDWSDNLSTKIKYSSYEMVEDDESVGNGLFPEMNIKIGGDNVFLGGDRYRGANYIEVNSNLLTFKADYVRDDHVYTFGYERDETELMNEFIARYNGEVRFNSFEDYQNGVWSRLRIHEPYAGHANTRSVAADFELEKTTMYIQDKRTVNDNLTIQLGLRYDAVLTPTAPPTNVAFIERFGYSNSNKFDFSSFQPRFSFNWNATDSFLGNPEKIVDVTVRGGRGLFLGRIPRVWYGNAYSRTGATADYRGWFSNCADNASVTNCPGNMPKGDPTAFWLGAGSNYVVPDGSSPYYAAQSTDANFQAPSSWRTSLALDIMTSGGWDVTLEYNHDEVDQAVSFFDPSLERKSTLADGRGTYDGKGIYQLTNDDQGRTEAYTISTSKDFGDLQFNAGYTHMNATDVYALTSAQSESAYGRMPKHDGENLSATRSNFMVEHKFISSLDYTTQLIGDNDTRFSLVYVAKSGEPYSVTFDGDSMTDGNDGYDLAYVPTGASDSKVEFASDAVAAAVMAHVNGSGLAGYRGTYAPRNAFNSPWIRSLDLRITQDIQVMEGHKVIVYLDITNILNLIDDEKGIVQEYGNRSRQIELSGISADGKFQISGVDPDDSLYVYNENGQSAYQFNLGFKYQF